MLNDIKFIEKRLTELRQYSYGLMDKANSGALDCHRFELLFSGTQHQIDFFQKLKRQYFLNKPNLLAKLVHEWADEQFNFPTTISVAKHFVREADELLDAIQLRYRVPNGEENIIMELADCFLLLIQLASRNGMSFDDLMASANEKFEINKNRKWSAPDADGISSHIE